MKNSFFYNNHNYNNSNTSHYYKTFKKRSSYDYPSYLSSSKQYYNNFNNNFNYHPLFDESMAALGAENFQDASYNTYNNYKMAKSNYEKLLNIFENLYKPHKNFLVQTPQYPKGNPYYGHRSALPDNEILPRRICGDWSSKLKLLRYVSKGSYLGLHFVSDYSHHFSGYKAKAYMENSKYDDEIFTIYLI